MCIIFGCCFVVHVLGSCMYQCFGFSVEDMMIHGEDLQLLDEGEQAMFTESGSVVFVAPGV